MCIKFLFCPVFWSDCIQVSCLKKFERYTIALGLYFESRQLKTFKIKDVSTAAGIT